ncbi:hypothetical protein ACLOJK_004482 [Asimina triloba]
MAGRVPSRRPQPATVASLAAVSAVGRYRSGIKCRVNACYEGKLNHFVNVRAIMALKRNVDKGKTPMVEEEPRGPRTQSRSSTLIIREQQERAHEIEDRAAQIGTSSDMPAGGQARIEETRTEETTGLRPERDEPSGKEMTPQVAVGWSNEDWMSVMIDIMTDMMSQLRDVSVGSFMSSDQVIIENDQGSLYQLEGVDKRDKDVWSKHLMQML